jgi:hypothetical protein
VRSRVRATWLAIVALACCVGSIASFAVPSVAVAAPDKTEISDALERVRADPNISPERKMSTLEWVDEDDPEQREKPGWFKWLAGLFAWIASASRIIVWSAIAVLLALLALFLKRVFSGMQLGNQQAHVPHAPTHVQELDIRPESLPDQIGAAVLALWERNDHRAALALLYRSLLSRLVYTHGVPIRESTTEADCLQLAVPRLHSDVAEYTTKLVRVWQHAVYGAREPAMDEVRALCSSFDRNFPPPVQSPGGQQ